MKLLDDEEFQFCKQHGISLTTVCRNINFKHIILKTWMYVVL
jgi:hypothetical protein